MTLCRWQVSEKVCPKCRNSPHFGYYFWLFYTSRQEKRRAAVFSFCNAPGYPSRVLYFVLKEKRVQLACAVPCRAVPCRAVPCRAVSSVGLVRMAVKPLSRWFPKNSPCQSAQDPVLHTEISLYFDIFYMIFQEGVPECHKERQGGGIPGCLRLT